jgi:EAL domain-containing protein (putative c-di-GMP-specific phosphodiesterase class I)/putative methionine-R-sulfoxide reductase with GAF domain
VPLALHEIIRDLTDPSVTMRRVLDAALRLMPDAEGASIQMVEGEDLVFGCTVGMLAPHGGIRVGMDGSLSGLAVRSGRPMRCDDAATDPRVDAEACARSGVQSSLNVPLTRDDHVVGVLTVCASRPRGFSTGDLERVAGLAGFVAAMVSAAWETSTIARALATGPDHEFVVDVLLPGAVSDAAMHGRMERLLREGDFDVVFQPILDLLTGRVVAAEALARFPGPPAQGPDVWFADAHRAGLGVELELALVRRALEKLATIDVARLAINLGPEALVAPELREMLSAGQAQRVTLELTEHLSIADYDVLCDALEPLRSLGVRLAIDDTGAGFSSLAHILKLDPDVIKLDRTLTAGIDDDAGRRAMAAALVGFATETGAHVVAEGIETQGQLDVVRDLGIDLGQGYLLGMPGDAAALRTAQYSS